MPNVVGVLMSYHYPQQHISEKSSVAGLHSLNSVSSSFCLVFAYSPSFYLSWSVRIPEHLRIKSLLFSVLSRVEH